MAGINPKTGKRRDWEAKQAAKSAAPDEELANIEKRLALLKRQQKAIEARERLMTFIKFTSPDPEDPSDVERSRYKNARHHDAIARVVEEVEKGEIPFLILTMPPRHGKSEIVSRRLPAWFAGRHPDQNVVVATYNDDFAQDFGKDVRSIMQSAQYKQVFPSVTLRRGGSASDRLQTAQGGLLTFVGRGGTLTGRGAHCLAAGTMVDTNLGPVAIEDLSLAHRVRSFDVKRGRQVWQRVVALASRPRASLLRITTETGRVVEATAEHRFYANGRWVRAEDLTPGDALLPMQVGRSDAVALVEDTRRSAVVYDIQVEETECFFANGLLTHNCLIIDDIISNAEQARSQTIRDQTWDWFTKVAMSRRMGKKLVVITFTRWHSDDIIGRLTDPENPHYNLKLAEKIKIINLPALAEDDDPLGRAPGEPLWPDGPDRFDVDFLQEQQMLDPLGFASLYQQRPSLLDGDMFKRENIRFYKQDELPEELRVYCSSDHAVATGQRNDYTVLLKVGIDAQSNIYLLECFWQRVKSDAAVEAMLTMASGKHKPLLWWAEKGHISKSIGPFLRKRMLETGTYINIREVTPAADKATRAQSIAARVAMGKVFFPMNAVWSEKAINELMAFPNGTHDDFADTLAYIGLGLQSQFAPAKTSARKVGAPEFGTLAWVKQADKWAEQKKARAAAGGF